MKWQLRACNDAMARLMSAGAILFIWMSRMSGDALSGHQDGFSQAPTISDAASAPGEAPSRGCPATIAADEIYSR